MEKTKETSYEQALKELEQIVRKLESDELDVDQISDQLRRAQELLRLCEAKLSKTDEEIKAILAASEA